MLQLEVCFAYNYLSKYLFNANFKNHNLNFIVEIFSKYSKGEREITEEGVGEFFSDLGVDPMDPVTLVISYHMEAKNMGEYTQTEFVTGFTSLGCNSISDLKK
jgi:hypothetical protein